MVVHLIYQKYKISYCAPNVLKLEQITPMVVLHNGFATVAGHAGTSLHV